MADRMDIDALLIGALYGELAPADEARLTAHLESHPADRTALDALTRTRAAVRDSRILAFQFEPPASVSALLLQEASRRAPRVQDSESVSWFQRFVRSFAAHPAMAAAATVVLVLGVAGTLYLRGVHQFADTAAPVSAVAPQADTLGQQAEAQNKATTVAAPTAGAPAADPAAVPPAPAEQAAAPGGAAAGSSGAGVVGAGSYRVDLDSSTGLKAPAAPANARGDDRFGKEADGAAEGRATGALKVGGQREDERAKDAALSKGKLVKQEVAKLRGIEVRRPEPMPKDLKDSDDEIAQRGAISKFGNDRAGAAGSTERDRRAQAPAGPAGAAAVATPPPPPAPSAVPEQAAPPPMAAAPAPRPTVPDAKRAVKSAPPASAAQAPQKPSPSFNETNQPSANQASNSRAQTKTQAAGNANDRSADKADARPADDKTRDAALLAWARKQRDQVVSLVTANNCDAAADAAMEIYNRAPGYFSSVILTDREVRPCLQYVTRQRDRAERSRAAKNANSATDQAPSRK